MATKYHPLTDPKYMSSAMKAFFREMLRTELNDLHRKCLAFGKTLEEDSIKEVDFVDQSSLTQFHFDQLAHNKRELQHKVTPIVKNTKQLFLRSDSSYFVHLSA